MSKNKDKKKGDGVEAPGAAAKVVSVGAHPRARASIRRTRGRTGLIAFALVLVLCLDAGVPAQEAALRALVGGVVGNLLAWACAVAVWRALVVAELKAVTEAYNQRVRAANEAAAEKAAAEARAAAAAA